MKLRRYRMAAILSRVHRFLYHMLNGRLVAHRGNADFLLLSAMGRRSKRKKSVVLLYVSHHGDPAVIASFGGNPKAPNWLLNVRDNPSVEVQVGTVRWEGTGSIASPEDREKLWPRFVDVFSGYEGYQARTTRKFPIVIITQNQQ